MGGIGKQKLAYVTRARGLIVPHQKTWIELGK
jgi:hypothetical protein